MNTLDNIAIIHPCFISKHNFSNQNSVNFKNVGRPPPWSDRSDKYHYIILSFFSMHNVIKQSDLRPLNLSHQTLNWVDAR